MKYSLHPLLLLALQLPAAATWSGPMCLETNTRCETTSSQLQSIYSPRPENNYGRRAGFLYQDYGKWRNAFNPPHPAPADFEKLNISESVEENYILGQRYVLLSPEQKWQVLIADHPERTVRQLETREHRRQVDREADFFTELPIQLKAKYMMLTPAMRHQAVNIRSRNEALRFLREQEDIFLVDAYVVNFHDIINHLKPHNAQPMLFPILDKPPG